MWKSIGLFFCHIIILLGVGCDSGFTEFSESASPTSSGQAQNHRPGHPQIGMSAFPFSLLDLAGEPAALSDFKGKVVLLNFWATWCGPCRVEMPSMEVVYKRLKDKGFEILAISTDPQGMAVTQPFIEANGLTFPVLHDSEYRVGSAYGVKTLPMSFLIDQDGIIRHRIFGARDWNSPEAKELLQTLLRLS